MKSRYHPAQWYNQRMTKSLQAAIERLQQLPEDRQDSLASLVLQEIEEDEKWLASTEQHSEKLGDLGTSAFLERVDLLKKIEAAERQIVAGETVPHELAKVQLEKWLE